MPTCRPLPTSCDAIGPGISPGNGRPFAKLFMFICRQFVKFTHIFPPAHISFLANIFNFYSIFLFMKTNLINFTSEVWQNDAHQF